MVSNCNLRKACVQNHSLAPLRQLCELGARDEWFLARNDKCHPKTSFLDISHAPLKLSSKHHQTNIESKISH